MLAVLTPVLGFLLQVGDFVRPPIDWHALAPELTLLAGEYVLGTLNADERSEVERDRQSKAGLELAIQGWENRLAPLLADIGPVAPNQGVYERIARELGDAPQKTPPPQSMDFTPSSTPEAAQAAPTEAAAPSSAPAAGLRVGQDPRPVVGQRAAVDEVSLPGRGGVIWRAWAILSTLALAALVAALILRPNLFLPQGERFVAVFQDTDQPPRFLLSIDLKSRLLTVHPVAAEPAVGKSYQLWIAAEALGTHPKSLGLLDGVDTPTRKWLGEIAPAILETALFGISMEPAGGSPSGTPTGPALHSKLIPSNISGP